MRLVQRLCLLLPLVFGPIFGPIMAGCGDTKFRADAMPPVEPNQARIVFFRNSSFIGADMQTGILYDGAKVGDSKPGTYFYIDTTPGEHDVSTTGDVNTHLGFPLAPGQTRYVKTGVGLGQFAGHIEPEVVDPNRAMRELPDLTFAPSGPTYVAGKPTAPAEQQMDAQPAGAMPDAAPSPAPANDAVPPPATAPDASSSPRPRLGSSSNSVEDLARRDKQCDAINGAELVSSDGPIEYYREQCRDGRVFRAKCQFHQCVETDSD